MNRLHDEPEHIDSRSDWRQVLWTGAGCALVVGLIVLLEVFKPGGC